MSNDLTPDYLAQLLALFCAETNVHEVRWAFDQAADGTRYSAGFYDDLNLPHLRELLLRPDNVRLAAKLGLSQALRDAITQLPAGGPERIREFRLYQDQEPLTDDTLLTQALAALIIRLPISGYVISDMDLIRTLCARVNHRRKAAGVKTRIPLNVIRLESVWPMTSPQMIT